MEKQVEDWEKMFGIHLSGNELDSRIYLYYLYICICIYVSTFTIQKDEKMPVENEQKIWT